MFSSPFFPPWRAFWVQFLTSEAEYIIKITTIIQHKSMSWQKNWSIPFLGGEPLQLLAVLPRPHVWSSCIRVAMNHHWEENIYKYCPIIPILRTNKRQPHFSSSSLLSPWKGSTQPAIHNLYVATQSRALLPILETIILMWPWEMVATRAFIYYDCSCWEDLKTSMPSK